MPKISNRELWYINIIAKDSPAEAPFYLEQFVLNLFTIDINLYSSKGSKIYLKATEALSKD